MRDLRRLKRLTQLKTRLRDAVRAHLAQADHLLQESEALEAEAERVYEDAITQATQPGEVPAHVLFGHAERAQRGKRDVNDAHQVVEQRQQAREEVQAELREAHREVKAMDLLTQRERAARRFKREQMEQTVADEVTASKRARSA
jgi:flagellar export protein FliJ